MTYAFNQSTEARNIVWGQFHTAIENANKQFAAKNAAHGRCYLNEAKEIEAILRARGWWNGVNRMA